MTQPCTHKFDLMAESRQANHYWCEKCGAYKRVPSGDHEDDQETTISLPKKS